MQMARRMVLALPGAWALGGFRASAQVANLDYRDRYLFVATRVNGRPFTALLDSAAQMSVIDTAAAATLGLEPAGTAVVRGATVGSGAATFARGAAIEVAGLTLHPAKVVVTDLSRVAAGPVPMILGREIFDAAVVAIDIGESTLTLRPPAAPRRGIRLPLTKQFGVETIPILIDGIPAQATFDLGNSGMMLVSAGFARRAGLLAPEREIGHVAVRGINGAAQRPVVFLHSVEVAGRKLAVPHAIIQQVDAASDALIGIDVLRHFRMVCDFAHRAVWLDPV